MAKNWNSLQMGISISSTDEQNKYTFRFKKKKDVYAIPVKPGEYYISKLVFATGGGFGEVGGFKEGEKTIKKLINNNKFQIEKGGAYYLGDFYSSTSTFGLPFPINGQYSVGVNYEWFLNQITNDFEKTTKDLNERYPLLSTISQKSIFAGKITKEKWKEILEENKDCNSIKN